MDILKIASLGIISAILALTIKKHSPVFAIAISIMTGVIIFIGIIPKLSAVLKMVDSLLDATGMNSAYIAIIMKIIGIAYVAQFCSQICVDAGENSIASKVELGGKILIMVSGAPVLLGLVDMVINLLP